MKQSHYPAVGSEYRVYGVTIRVTYAAHGSIVLSRGGKYEVQLSPQRFKAWLVDTGAVLVSTPTETPNAAI